MSENHDNLVPKDICEKEHQVVDDKLVDLKANIRTSKESLGNRLDKVDTELHKALLGDITSPGGLLSDVKALKTNIKKAKEDWEEHKDTIDDKIKTQNFRMKLCLILVGILIGGKVLGFSITAIVDYMKPPTKPTPIVAPAPEIEGNDKVPQAIKDFIKEQLENKNIEIVQPEYMETIEDNKEIFSPEEEKNVNPSVNQ